MFSEKAGVGPSSFFGPVVNSSTRSEKLYWFSARRTTWNLGLTQRISSITGPQRNSELACRLTYRLSKPTNVASPSRSLISSPSTVSDMTYGLMLMFWMATGRCSSSLNFLTAKYFTTGGSAKKPTTPMRTTAIRKRSPYFFDFGDCSALRISVESTFMVVGRSPIQSVSIYHVRASASFQR